MYQPHLSKVERFRHYMAVERHCSERTSDEYCRDVERFARYIAPRSLRKAKPKHIRRSMLRRCRSI